MGKTSTKYIADAIGEFLKRINRYAPMEILTVPDLKSTRGLTEDVQKQREGAGILSMLQGGDHVCLLDERGREISAKHFFPCWKRPPQNTAAEQSENAHT